MNKLSHSEKYFLVKCANAAWVQMAEKPINPKTKPPKVLKEYKTTALEEYADPEQGYGSKAKVKDKIRRAGKYQQNFDGNVTKGFWPSTNLSDYKQEINVTHSTPLSKFPGAEGEYLTDTNTIGLDPSKHSDSLPMPPTKFHEFGHYLQHKKHPDSTNENRQIRDKLNYSKWNPINQLPYFDYLTDADEVGTRLSHVVRAYERNVGEVNTPEDAKKAMQWYKNNYKNENVNAHGRERWWLERYNTEQMHKRMPGLVNTQNNLNKIKGIA